MDGQLGRPFLTKKEMVKKGRPNWPFMWKRHNNAIAILKRNIGEKSII